MMQLTRKQTTATVIPPSLPSAPPGKFEQHECEICYNEKKTTICISRQSLKRHKIHQHPGSIDSDDEDYQNEAIRYGVPCIYCPNKFIIGMGDHFNKRHK